MVPPNLNKDDPCYIGIRRIGDVLRKAESEGRIQKKDLRLDTFFTADGGIRGYRVSLRSTAGWHSVTFPQEDLASAEDEGSFRRVAEQLGEILERHGADPDEA